jgi:nucleobase:cation symporter-1, NCS1 family
MSEYANNLNIESHSIDYIPDELRHGSVKSLFTLWFGANMQAVGIVTGALAVLFGLSLPWAILGVIIGNLFGGIFMALHSAQGPKLGIPQMIQSRAQFGFYGAILPLVLVILMYIGFFSTGNILGAQALSDMSGLGLSPAIVVIGVLCTVVTIFGYKLIHNCARWISLLCGAGFVYLTVELVVNNHLGAVWHASGFKAGPFVLGITAAATYQITYAPYVADYSRYLPRNTSISSCFWWTYAGSVIGTSWMMVFGCIAAAVATTAFDSNSVAFIVNQAAGGRFIFDIIVALGIIIIGVLNLYSAFMSAVTTLSALWRRHVGVGIRSGYIIVASAVGTALSIAGRGNFLNNYYNFILFLSYFIVPWTAINLVDFYLIRKEKYNIPAVFDPNGEYGKVRWQAVGAYLFSIGVQIPFMNTTFYTGPFVAKLGGADISWMIGVVVSGFLYLAVMRLAPPGAGRARFPGARSTVSPAPTALPAVAAAPADDDE